MTVCSMNIQCRVAIAEGSRDDDDGQVFLCFTHISAQLLTVGNFFFNFFFLAVRISSEGAQIKTRGLC